MHRPFGGFMRDPRVSKGMAMVLDPRSCDALRLRVIAGLALMGWPTVGSAAGTWSEISLPPPAGGSSQPASLAVDAAENLYVADFEQSRIQRRDAAGNWTLLAAAGDGSGQVHSPSGLAVDPAGNLYVADWAPAGNGGRIQKRDTQGNWSIHRE